MLEGEFRPVQPDNDSWENVAVEEETIENPMAFIHLSSLGNRNFTQDPDPILLSDGIFQRLFWMVDLRAQTLNCLPIVCWAVIFPLAAVAGWAQQED
jgi:hypothetical protein